MRKILSLLFLLVVLTSSYVLNWTAPLTISSGPFDLAPQVAIDQNGNAVAVWQSTISGINQIQSVTKLLTDTSWSTPVMISTLNHDSVFPDIAVDGSGNAVAVWLDNNLVSVQSATKLFGAAWSAPVTISTALSATSIPVQVAVDPAGNAVAVWEDFDFVNNVSIIRSATKLFGNPWVVYPSQLSPALTNAVAPQVGVDSSGNAQAVWRIATGGGHSTIQVATKPFGGAWSAPINISNAGNTVSFPQLAVNPNGDAVAVWTNATTGDIEANNRDVPGSWSLANLVNISLAGFTPDIAIDPSGNALAIWATSTQIQSGSKLFTLPWSSPPPDVVTTAPAGNLQNPHVAVDAHGNAVVVFNNDSTNTIQAATKEFSHPWNTPVDISTVQVSGHSEQQTAVQNTTGNAIAIWTFNTGGNSFIQAASGFVPMNPLQPFPPSNLTLKQKKNDFAVLSEYFNVLKWQASTSINVTGYRIFRDGVAIATVGADQLQYKDHDQKKDGPVTYGVASINNLGTLSTMMTISLP